MSKYCVLIPSYNESKTIGQLVWSLRSQGFIVYIVDDGSVDNTAAIAEREGAAIIHHGKNMGKGAAIRDGFARVVADGFDGCLVMDGDGQHTVEDAIRFFNEARSHKADMIIGNRMHDTASMPVHRNYTNRFMSWMISKFAGQYVPDTQCGFRFLRRPVLETVRLESSNFEIESEMIIKAARANFKIGSLPIQTVYADEKSRINPFVDTLRFIALMTKILWQR
jgi:glycosyltransferase involved in cell wall biosynthesis